MYIWARLVRTVIAARCGKPLAGGATKSSVVGRIWPQDLDINLHVNNGRYLTLMDLGRLDFVFRSGLGSAGLKGRRRPVLTGLSARYKSSLGLFQKYRMETELIGWTERSIFMEHRIIPLSGPARETVAVTAVVRAVILEPDNSKVETRELLSGLGYPAESPPLSESCASLLSPAERAALHDAGAGGGRRRDMSFPERSAAR
ncbi:thioesterase family protein [Martelella soudanensis]|uniref:thioesterase family protein n=1 Tax=unclassified Martelella TaxID=2629616 RepID=UPI0015DE8029|nr:MULTISPECIES: thioesterase family protein [unclassified Martelella]